MEAEKQWLDWDQQYRGEPGSLVSRESREAYKSQLKKLIEERIARLEMTPCKDEYQQGALDAYRSALNFTNQVKPPKP